MTAHPLAVGDVLDLAEDDYRFGVGNLVLRLVAVLHVQQLADGPWIYVRGVVIRWDGSDGEARQVLVRQSAVVRSRRRPRNDEAPAARK